MKLGKCNLKKIYFDQGFLLFFYQNPLDSINSRWENSSLPSGVNKRFLLYVWFDQIVNT